MKPAASAGTIPVCGMLSRATPTRPVPAITAVALRVSGLMSSGTSIPLYLPPSSIAICAARAYVIRRAGFERRNTVSASMS